MLHTEMLETRRLFSGFTASIHFQPANLSVPDGFVADSGSVFGDRGNGLWYGWNAPRGARVVEHRLRVVHEPDPLYDSFAIMHPQGRGSQWRIAVPNGDYQLSITAGDPLATHGRESINANGSLFLDSNLTSLDRWVTGSAAVHVADGFITLTVPRGRRARIDFLTIGPVVAPDPTLTYKPLAIGGAFTPNQTLFAADYNTGGEGVAYHDTTLANQGGDPYRSGDAVDIMAGGTGGHVVGFTAPGEWLDYTLNVPSAGYYRLEANIANPGSNAAIHAEFEGSNVAGQNLTGAMVLPNTGGWSTYGVTSSRAFTLPAGTTIMRIVMDKNSTANAVGNFDWFKLVPATASTNTPFLNAPFAPGQSIPAAEYDNGGEGIAYHDSTLANLGHDAFRAGDAVDIQTGGPTGHMVGYTSAGEWLDYTVNVPAAGAYALQAIVANSASGGTFHAEFGGNNLSGSNLTGAIAVGNTGSFTTFRTVTSGSFTLPAGKTVMRIVLDKNATSGAVGNFAGFELVAASVSSRLTWRSVAPIPLGMTEAMGEVVGGKVYVFGGYTNNTFLPSKTVYCYDIASNTWTRKHDMPVGTTHTGTAVDGQYIYLAGGYPPNSTNTYQIFTTVKVWRYDTVSDTWTAMPNLPQGRGAGQLARAGRSLYYFSGADATRIDRHEMWALNLDNLAGGWQARAPIPTARNHVGAVELNGLIYAIGGAYKQDSAETALNTVEAYDPASDSWSSVTSLPTPLALIMAGCDSINGHLVVAGGETGWNLTVNAVREYDPATRTWNTLTPLPLKRESGILRNLGDGRLIYIAGHPGFNNNVWIGSFG